MGSLNKRDNLKNTFLISVSLLLIANLLAVLINWIVLRSFLKHFASVKETNNAENIGHTNEVSNNYIVTRDKETPPLIMGPRRLHYIFATALPQTYLTLLSVLQGLVFGVLLLNISLPSNINSSTFFPNILQHYLYLPYIISSLVILIVWSQFVHGILFLTWPFTVFQSSLIFLMSLVEILTFAHTNVLSDWIFGLGWIAIVGALIRFNNIRYLPNDKHTWITSVNNYVVFSKRTEISDGILYMSLGIIVVAFSYIFNSITNVTNAQDILFPTIIKWSSLTFLFLSTCIILLIDKANRRIYLKIFVGDSDLVASPQGIISYKKEIERKLD